MPICQPHCMPRDPRGNIVGFGSVVHFVGSFPQNAHRPTRICCLGHCVGRACVLSSTRHRATHQWDFAAEFGHCAPQPDAAIFEEYSIDSESDSDDIQELPGSLSIRLNQRFSLPAHRWPT